MFHYYLSREVSKLFVYYAWLVRLFYNQPGLLAFNTAMPQSSFLWARRDTENKNWDSVQLSHILASQFEESLGTSINIIIWRHVAVAASRRHLKSGQFKRDYDVVGNYADHQTAQRLPCSWQCVCSASRRGPWSWSVGSSAVSDYEPGVAHFSRIQRLLRCSNMRPSSLI